MVRPTRQPGQYDRTLQAVNTTLTLGAGYDVQIMATTDGVEVTDQPGSYFQIWVVFW